MSDKFIAGKINFEGRTFSISGEDNEGVRRVIGFNENDLITVEGDNGQQHSGVLKFPQWGAWYVQDYRIKRGDYGAAKIPDRVANWR